MKFPWRCTFHLPKWVNLNLTTPWGSYRHGSDPPDYRELPKDRILAHPSVLDFCRTNHSYSLSFGPTGSPIPEHSWGSHILLVRKRSPHFDLSSIYSYST